MALINTTTTGVLGSTFFGDGTGSLTIQQNGVTLNTITSAPAFRAYKSAGNQSVTTGTFTKLTFQTADFNVGNCYDTSNSRFTPTVAGYYNITAAVGTEGSTTLNRSLIQIYKNGSGISSYLQDLSFNGANVNHGFLIGGSDLIYMNGTTDYVEIYAYISGTGLSANNNQTRFNAFLARSA
jgi:hypothetical protein